MRIRPEFCRRRLGSYATTMICKRLLSPFWQTTGRGAALICVAISLVGCAKKEASVAAAPEVEIVPVTQQDVPLYTECIATLDGYVNAQIQPQVGGYLMKQNYTEGTVVHKGEVLFEIDPRPFEAALQQSKGQLAQSEAQLGKTRFEEWLRQPSR